MPSINSEMIINKKWYTRILHLLLFIELILGSILLWYIKAFGVSINEILYTLNSPLIGADVGFVWDILIYVLIGIVLLVAAIIIIRLLFTLKSTRTVDIKWFGKSKKVEQVTLVLGIFLVIAYLGAANVLVTADEVLEVTDYVYLRTHKTDIYDKYYVEPNCDAIKSKNDRNLLLIVLESMETTYASKSVGGYQANNNYIPHLTEYANEYTSFSNSEKLGGFHSITGAGWTMGALFSMESGIPFSFPVEINSMNQYSTFATGTITLGDILHKKGYYQEFICGSDAEFAGRRHFFEQHGETAIYDLNTAINDGIMTTDDIVWWGFEDYTLYSVAKDELTKMSEGSQPFNCTILTVDTHNVDGWICKLCKEEYPERLANIVACADRQIYEFIEWCKEQDWYENTTIVIVGDHPRMDQSLVDGVEYYDRTIYNCFINADIGRKKMRLKNREFTALDLYPTILASMGFEIPDDRLGLGTNLFSNRKTLAEELGFEYLNQEVSKYSDYYKNFY